MKALPLSVLLTVAGCTSPVDPSTEPDDTAGTPYADIGGTTDSGMGSRTEPLGRTGQFGSVALIQTEENLGPKYGYLSFASVTGWAVVTTEDPGVSNLVGCYVNAVWPCIEEFPGVEGIADGVSLPKFDTLDPGQITAAGIPLEYGEVGGVGLSAGGSAAALSGPGNLSIQGRDIAAYGGTEVFDVVDESLDGVTPDPLVPLAVTDQDSLVFTWTPGSGSMYFAAGDKVFGLDDATGSFEVAVSDLGFEGPTSTNLVRLARTTYGEVDAAGNLFRMETRVEQPFVVLYTDSSATTLVDGTDIAGDCKSAAALTPLEPGSYAGSTASYDNDADLLQLGPTPYYDSAGRDAFLRIELKEGDVLSATYRQEVIDAVLYLLSDNCTTVLASADDVFGNNAESISYTASRTRTVFLVLDSVDPLSGGAFSLTVGR